MHLLSKKAASCAFVIYVRRSYNKVPIFHLDLITVLWTIYTMQIFSFKQIANPGDSQHVTLGQIIWHRADATAHVQEHNMMCVGWSGWGGGGKQSTGSTNSAARSCQQLMQHAVQSVRDAPMINMTRITRTSIMPFQLDIVPIINSKRY